MSSSNASSKNNIDDVIDVQAIANRYVLRISDALNALSIDEVQRLVAEIEQSTGTASLHDLWRVGQRVMRIDSEQHGTIVLMAERMKVKWDNGATSYYNPGRQVSIRRATFKAGSD